MIGSLDGELKGSAVITNGRLRLDGKTAYLETSSAAGAFARKNPGGMGESF